MKPLADPMSTMLARAIDIRVTRQTLLAGNLANVDTPGYQPVDMAFEGALASAIEGQGPVAMGRTSGGHLGATAADAPVDEIILRPDIADSLDRNGVDLDKEAARFADNAARLKATIEIARRRYALMTELIQKAG